MIICWDQIEKYKLCLSSIGNFKVWSGSQWKTVHYHESCESCKEPYISGKHQRFCSKSCSNRHTMLKNPDRSHHLLEKGRQTKLEKYGDEHYNNFNKSKETKLEKYGHE